MDKYNLGAMESEFADMIWEHTVDIPIPSGELVKLCEKKFSWKKSTTYTMLRRLCQREIFVNEDGYVRPLMTRDEFAARQSENFIDDTYGGSLPKFIAAFASRRKLTEKEIAELQALIDSSKEE